MSLFALFLSLVLNWKSCFVRSYILCAPGLCLISFHFDLIFRYMFVSFVNSCCLWPETHIGRLNKWLHIIHTVLYSVGLYVFVFCLFAFCLILSDRLTKSIWTCLRCKKTCYCFSIALNVHVYRTEKNRKKNPRHTNTYTHTFLVSLQ